MLVTMLCFVCFACDSYWALGGAPVHLLDLILLFIQFAA